MSTLCNYLIFCGKCDFSNLWSSRLNQTICVGPPPPRALLRYCRPGRLGNSTEKKCMSCDLISFNLYYMI